MSGLGRDASRDAADFDTGLGCSGGVQQEPQVASVAQPASVNKIVRSNSNYSMSSSKRNHGDGEAQGVSQEIENNTDTTRQDRQEKVLTAVEDWNSLLQHCIIDANPTHASGWIIAARLQEVAGKLAEARQLLQRGCEMCPQNENIWLQAARLQTPADARAIVARGLAANLQSVKLWVLGSQLEDTDEAKLSILNRALKHIPTALTLWQAAVESASDEHARVLLSEAVKWCPQHLELWLALAKLEPHQTARLVLNHARRLFPTAPALWITAAKVEEAQGNVDNVSKVIDRGITSLTANGANIDREFWLKEAEAAEKSQPPMIATCQACVKAAIERGIEQQDCQRIWMADAVEAIKQGSVETARTIYQHAVTMFPSQEYFWHQAALLEKSNGTRDSLETLLQKALVCCPQAGVLQLMLDRE